VPFAQLRVTPSATAGAGAALLFLQAAARAGRQRAEDALGETGDLSVWLRSRGGPRSPCIADRFEVLARRSGGRAPRRPARCGKAGIGRGTGSSGSPRERGRGPAALLDQAGRGCGGLQRAAAPLSRT